jgi:hypothetical protein
MNQPPPLFLSVQHPESMRHAIVSDEGASVWLYLTEPASSRPSADCWLFNTIPAPTDLSNFQSRNGPPPAIQQFATPSSQRQPPNPTEVTFLWSSDGHSIALLIKGELFGFICAGDRKGFSKNLLTSGPWGAPVDATLYTAIFAPACAT